jgi:hypothetical protein
MLSAGYRDLFTVIATSAAALTGLLFIVVTVAERREPGSLPAVVQEVRAAAALLSFMNALTVSLFSLVPGTNAGYPALVVGIIGLLFSAAAIRSILGVSRPVSDKVRPVRNLVLTLLLLLVFAAEALEGIDLIQHPHQTGPLEYISQILIASILVGVARAWELVGGRDTGILASLAVLSGRDAPTRPHRSTPRTGSGEREIGDTSEPE